MQTNALDFFEKGARFHSPDGVAIVDGSVSWTFDELLQRSRRVVPHIVTRELRRGAPIAVFLPRGADVVAVDLGILYAGHPYANLDAKSPTERLRAIMAQLQPELVITNAKLAPLLPPGSYSVLLLEEIASGGDHWTPQLDALRAGVLDTDPMCIIHTSGSTGVPKAVALPHRGTIDFVDWAVRELDLQWEHRVGSLAPFHFDIYTLELFACLHLGTTLVIIPDGVATFPHELARFLEREEIGLVFWVPTIMVNIASQDAFKGCDLSAIRRVLFAGEVLLPKALRYWRAHLPQAKFVNLYGPIEASVDCAYHIVDRDHADDDPIPIGRPCANTGLIVLDEKNNEVRGQDQGELCVRGSGVALGYWNDSERTARAFVQNPLNQHHPETIYRTGDLVHRNAAGELMFDGRRDHQIKHFGHRIELGEIERAALKLNGLRNCCAVYWKDLSEIGLYYEADHDLEPGTIRKELSEWLPKYMLPTAFHRVSALPMNANGKVDRALLAQVVV